MKALRIDLYTGYADDPSYTEKDVIVQCDGETDEEIIELVIERLMDNLQQLRGDEDDDDDTEE